MPRITQDQPDDGDTAAGDVPRSTTPSEATPSTAGAEEAAVRERIAQLERLKELQDREKELTDLIRSYGGGGPAKRGRKASSSSSLSSQEVKVRNITELRHPTNPQKHKIWLNDLSRAFKGAKKKYRRDDRKILFALDHMHMNCRARWDRYVEEQLANGQDHPEDDWDKFQDWTLTLLKDSASRDAQMATQLENAKQKEGQSPIEFSIYLDSLEKHLERAPEKTRALTFFAKLLPDLQDHINLHADITGLTREDVVQLAQRFWEAMSKNKRKPNDSEEKGPHKAARHQRRDSPRGHRPNRDRRDKDKDEEKTPATYPNNDRPRGRKQCFNCGSTEHLIYNCDKPRKDRREGQENSQRQK